MQFCYTDVYWSYKLSIKTNVQCTIYKIYKNCLFRIYISREKFIHLKEAREQERIRNIHVSYEYNARDEINIKIPNGKLNGLGKVNNMIRKARCCLSYILFCGALPVLCAHFTTNQIEISLYKYLHCGNVSAQISYALFISKSLLFLTLKFIFLFCLTLIQQILFTIIDACLYLHFAHKYKYLHTKYDSIICCISVYFLSNSLPN